MPQNGNGSKNGGTAELEDATELFTRYSSGVYRYCLRRLGSPEEAEDALQVTYLNAWRSLKRGFEPDQGRPWLFQIASNVCSGVLRSKLRGTRLELRDPSTLDELAALEDPDSEELLGLSEALRELPSRQRRALVLRDWQGLSYNEIAAEMAVSDAAVETLLFRARKKVATTLANADWRRRVAPSARALLAWPFAFLRTKSAATAGGEHIKIALALAGGTVAPLVLFGLIQTFLPGHEQTARATPTPALAQPESLQPRDSWLGEGLLLHTSALRASAPETGVRPQSALGKHAASRRAAADETRSPSNAETPSVPHEPKIVLCHETHSGTRPGVTISVSKHALNGLGGDSPGACG